MLKTQTYCFFDQKFELRSDHADTLALMDAVFKRFAVEDNEHNGEKLIYEVLTNVGGAAGIRYNDYSYIVEQPKLLPSLAHGIILRNTLARIHSHLLFHAAALSYQDKGVILAADSGCGKTTLALALLQRGFKLLSDETAALEYHSGKLSPYPRCLWVRPGTYQVFQQHGWNFPSHQIATKIDNRTAIHISNPLLGKHCLPNYLFIIKHPDEGDERICEISLDSLPNKLLAELSAIGIETVITASEAKKGFPIIKAKEAQINKIYQACERQGVLVLHVNETEVVPSYYNKTPQLQNIGKLTAAFALLRSFLGGYRSVFIQQDCQGHVASLIQPLVKILHPVKCYQLTVGKLNKTVEIIDELCKS